MADQAKFLSFMDMIDGGGAGRRGDKFEGGGIFSALANMIAKPYGSEDPERAARRDAAYRAAGLLDTQPEAAPAPQVVRGGGMTPAPLTYGPQNGRGGRRGVSPEERLMQQSLTANPLYAQAAAEMGMGLDPFGSSAGSKMPAFDPRNFAPNTEPSTGVGLPAVDPRNFAPNTQPSAGVDAPYNEFINRVRNDPLFAGIINDPVAMRNIFNMYQAQTQRMGQ